MKAINPSEWKKDLPAFREKTKEFYEGTIDKGAYKGFSGLYGSYAQKGGKANMLRLRMPGGRVTQEKLRFVADAIRRYDVDTVHFTTCQTIQLHNLNQETVCDLMEQALDVGIVTMGGGGDYPRNVMCSPLSGVEEGEYMDVLPWAEAAGEYLMHFIKAEKMPRKLKVGFSSSPVNATHATFRDMGFVAREDGRFDVYSAGGLGNNPRFGVKMAEGVEPEKILYYIKAMWLTFRAYGNYENRDVYSAGGLGNNPRFGVKMAEGVEPEKILYYIKAMWLTFRAYGNYENRGKARTRYMQESLGSAEAYREAYLEKLAEVFAENEDLTIHPEAKANRKEGDKTAVSGRRILPQKQEGLYTVVWHPIGGQPAPEKLAALSDALQDMEDAEMRLAPDETAYIINLTGKEAEKVLELTADGAETVFETSVSCIGATICQVGARDSQGLLAACVKAVREANIPDGALPQIHISGCPSSCGTHQIGELGFRGGVKMIDKKPQPAFVLYVGGCDRQGEETMGREFGPVLETEIPGFLVKLGKTVAESGLDFAAWKEKHPQLLEELARECTQ